MSVLQETIKSCAEWLDRHKRPNQRIGEQNTKAALIEPVLRALGWDTLDPDEVNREYRRRGTDNPVDYALLLLRTPRLFVEAKGLGENLDDPRWANQTISYATVAGVEWVVLTDGAQWRIYNAHAPVPIEDKLFRSVDVAQDPDGAGELLNLLSKENMRENRIHELWQSFHVDRQIHTVLTGLFTGSEPPNDLVNVVAKRADGMSRDVVRRSLVRARARFDFPLPNLGDSTTTEVSSAPRAMSPPALRPDQVPSTPRPVASPGPNRTSETTIRRSGIDPVESALKLVDLLRLGRIEPGLLTAQYDGQPWQAHVDALGKVTFRGQPCSSLSQAGKQVKLASRGPQAPESVTSTDGWEFWSVRDVVVGDTAKLKEVRRRAAANHEG